MLIAFPEKETADMADDKMLRELTSDPKFRKVLVTDGKTAVGQAVVRALAQAGADIIWVGHAEPWKKLGGLDDRHQALHRASRVHLLADDHLDLADDPQAHGHVVVDARPQALDHASAHHQLVADDLRVCGRFLEGGDEELGGFHGRCDEGQANVWQKRRPGENPAKSGQNWEISSG